MHTPKEVYHNTTQPLKSFAIKSRLFFKSESTFFLRIIILHFKISFHINCIFKIGVQVEIIENCPEVLKPILVTTHNKIPLANSIHISLKIGLYTISVKVCNTNQWEINRVFLDCRKQSLLVIVIGEVE